MGVKPRKKYTIPWYEVIAGSREEALVQLKYRIDLELFRVRRGEDSANDYSMFECSCIDDQDRPLVGEALSTCDCEEVCQEVSF